MGALFAEEDVKSEFVNLLLKMRNGKRNLFYLV